jgi:glucoamylase
MKNNYFRLEMNNIFPYSSFDLEEYKKRFLDNINICDLGTIAAGTSSNSGSGGSYFYCWLRDSSSSMIRIQNILPFNEYEHILKRFIDFIEKTLSFENPNGIDIRGEPKFNLPDGTVYNGPWARPQNDGTAICAIALILFASNLIKNNQRDYVNKKLWNKFGGIIKIQLDYVLQTYNSFTYDLWEEVSNTSFFWNLCIQRLALICGSVISIEFGEYDLSKKYLEHSKIIKNQLQSDKYYNGISLIEADNRKYDTAVILGLISDYEINKSTNNIDYLFEPSSFKIAQTVYNFNCLFSDEYPINLQDTKNLIPGLLYGRYNGDTYNGGNPWVCLSVHVALIYYNASEYILNNGLPSPDAITLWLKSINVNISITNNYQLSKLLFEAGESILIRIKYHTKGNFNNLFEQIDKNTGFMISSENLTVNYVMILTCINFRNSISSKFAIDI